ncbi:cytidyltransferase, partial [Candidatus Roizmanbacteria bacterium CG_4_10_14_0_2_um_filter_36_9]
MVFDTALIIGRFQPFHKGHVYLLEESFKLAEKVIIGIGSINIDDENNPYSQKDVEEMIKNVLSDRQWADRVIQIIGIPDFYDDQKWLEYINRNCLPFDVVISNN